MCKRHKNDQTFFAWAMRNAVQFVRQHFCVDFFLSCSRLARDYSMTCADVKRSKAFYTRSIARRASPNHLLADCTKHYQSIFLMWFSIIGWLNSTMAIQGRLDSWMVSHLALNCSMWHHFLDHEFVPWRWQTLYWTEHNKYAFSWFYVVYLIQYYYLSVKFVLWIVKLKT